VRQGPAAGCHLRAEGCCPAAPAAPAAAGVKPSGEKVTVAADALFDFNKAVLRPEGKAKLDEVVAKSRPSSSK
jgi:OOP family OmpA-OmpF porin